ncbi:MAG: hypothetical protein HYY49_09430 [Ignavibacteriales bacterium]|nr:hypothetical protein [Ignavibacteriales bacterium]
MKAAVFKLTSVFLLFSLFVQCGTTMITVPVMRPAEINLGKLKKVAVGRVSGEAARDVEDDLIGQLIESNAFEVLDRSNLDKIIREYRLSMSELIDEKTALQLGSLIGAAALIFARVADHRYNEQVLQGEPYKDKEGKTHVRHTREGKARVTINFRITDLTTGRFIFSKDITHDALAQTSAVDGRPPRIEDEDLLRSARRNIVRQFVSRIAPHWESVRVKMLTDSEMPELESGVSYAKIREWDRAIELFTSATEKYAGHESRHKAFYNLGVAYEFSARFEEAVAALHKAYELKADSEYLAEIESCRRREREYKKVQEQLENQ